MRRTHFPASPDEIRDAPWFNQYWYYAIELTPGLFTQGEHHDNIVLTRTILRNCGVEDQRCLDIGTMEGLVPVLLSRRGVREVVSLDALDCSGKIACVQHYTGAKFVYHPAVKLDDAVSLLQAHGTTSFDVVTLSGVLYHVFNPMHALGVARSMLRNGGLMIVETAAVREDSFAMYFNRAGGVYVDPTSFWFPTVPVLDYILRYFKLAPLDCFWMGDSKAMGKRFSRVAVVCRAVEDIVPNQDDAWMRNAMQTVDYESVVRWDLAGDARREPVSYTGAAKYCHRDTGTCDLYRTVRLTRPLKADRELIRLSLGQQF